MWKDFKEFAFKGNVIDMAVGVIIGGAFGKIVTSLVNDIMMPILGYFTSGMDFKDLKIQLGAEEYGVAVKKGNKELLDAVNAQIEKMLSDGTIDALCEKYEG